MELALILTILKIAYFIFANIIFVAICVYIAKINNNLEKLNYNLIVYFNKKNNEK